MAATDARIQANRANALKSTGPRTEAGKARSRLNALKHGKRSKAVAAPVLPQEDAAELGRRIQDWIDSYQPTNAVERDLVSRAARASWALDRAERAEAALLSRRVRRALIHLRARRSAKVCDLGRKLLFMAGKRILPGTGPEWADDPAAFVAALEEIPEGARWLRDRWTEIQGLILADEPWTYLDQFRFIRLMGRHPFDAIDDPETNAVFLAWEAIDDGWGVRFWKLIQENTPYQDPAFSACRHWREIAPRPVDKEAGIAHLRAVAAAHVARLDARIAALDDADGVDALEIADRASFSPGDDAERLRRFQAARSREMIRTLDALHKLRKESARPEPRTRKPSTSTPSPSTLTSPPEPEPETLPVPNPNPNPDPVPPQTQSEVPARASSTSPRPASGTVESLPPSSNASPAHSHADAAAVKILKGSHRESETTNEARPNVAQVVSSHDVSLTLNHPARRDRTHPVDPTLRRMVRAVGDPDATRRCAQVAIAPSSPESERREASWSSCQ